MLVCCAQAAGTPPAGSTPWLPPRTAPSVESSLAAQAAELQALRSAVSELVDLVKREHAPLPPPPQPQPPRRVQPQRAHTARRAAIPSNWTGGAAIRVFTKASGGVWLSECGGTLRARARVCV